MIPFPPTHTLPTHQCTKITRFPSGLRLAKLRNTSNQTKKIEVGCQISHCETMGCEEYLNIGRIDGSLVTLLPNGLATITWGYRETGSK